MKKFLAVFLVCLFGVADVQAFPFHAASGHGYHGHYMTRHKSEVVRPRRGTKTSSSFLTGMTIGTIIGSYIVSNAYVPSYYSETECYVMVSRRHGSTVERCVNRRLPRNEMYNFLYID